MSARDDIRKATLGQNVPFKKEVVNYNGIDVEIRQPTHLSRRDLFKKATDDSGKIEMLHFLAYAVIYNTFVPDTDELVFEEADFDVMVAKPAGGFLDKFGGVASQLLNVEEDAEKN